MRSKVKRSNQPVRATHAVTADELAVADTSGSASHVADRFADRTWRSGLSMSSVAKPQVHFRDLVPSKPPPNLASGRFAMIDDGAELDEKP